MLAIVMTVVIACLPAGCSDKSRDEIPSTCGELERELAAELTFLQKCSEHADCGKDVPAFGSCGCTRNPVIRKNADPARYLRVYEAMQTRQCEAAGLMGTCDCPPAEGYRCSAGRCAWNYTQGGVYELR